MGKGISCANHKLNKYTANRVSASSVSGWPARAHDVSAPVQTTSSLIISNIVGGARAHDESAPVQTINVLIISNLVGGEGSHVQNTFNEQTANRVSASSVSGWAARAHDVSAPVQTIHVLKVPCSY